MGSSAGVEVVGEPCNRHGPYTFYKAFRFPERGSARTVAIGEFFFVKVWSASDLVSIGELQLLWQDKNSQQLLASLRLYFLPENTPDGRNEDHGEDEVVAISEKVVLRVNDLVSWMSVGGPGVEWRWGHRPIGDDQRQHVVVMSFPRYCRYRSVAKRLEGRPDGTSAALVVALGGLADPKPGTAVLFCRDNFDCPELESHELLCNHLAPKFAGRPRKKKWRNSSPGSDSNESDGSSYSVESIGKVKRLGLKQPQLTRPGVRRGPASGRRSKQETEFLEGLYRHMAQTKQPIEKVPNLGFKQLDLWALYKKVREFGGYNNVTRQRMWKRVYDELGGSQANTSAATCTRKHYERLLLAYETKLDQMPKKRGRKPKQELPAVVQQIVTQPTTMTTTTAAAAAAATAHAQDRRQMVQNSQISADDPPALKRRKLEMLARGGLDIRPVGTAPTVSTPPSASPAAPEVSITVTPDVALMLEGPGTTSMFARTGRVYGNPRLVEPRLAPPPNPESAVLDLTVKSAQPRPAPRLPDVSILPQNGHHPPPKPKPAGRSGSSLEITLVPANGSRGRPATTSGASAAPPPGAPQGSQGAAAAAAALYYNAALSQMLQQEALRLHNSELYKSLLAHQAPLLNLFSLGRPPPAPPRPPGAAPDQPPKQ